MEYKVGFIGAGNMGGALARAAAKSTDNIAIADNDRDKAKSLAEEISAVSTDNKDICENAKYIFLGVKPQVLPALFSEIAPILKKRKTEFILVTMAAGKSIVDIEALCGKKYPIIRIMPNMPVSIGEGMILYCTNELVENAEEFTKMMKESGTLDKIPEGMIDAACSITACGPAYVFMFIESMADGGVECGIPRDKAISYACQTLIGSAKLVLETKKHPESLKDDVCSPGGTTIAGVHALENKGFRGAVSDSVKAAYEKTLKM